MWERETDVKRERERQREVETDVGRERDRQTVFDL